jgi:TRAP-type mannitol/chloroaromatic compound transport system substrate-binding protein
MKSFLQFLILQFCILTAGYSQTPLPPPANKVALVIGNAKYAGDSRLNVANYYYEEGWQEPNTTFELLINQKMLDALDESTRNGLINLIEKYNKSIYTKYLDKNAEYKHKMLEENIVFKHFPEAVLVELRREAAVVLQQYIHSDESKWCEKIYNSYRNF